jgi:hypothetical protein
MMIPTDGQAVHPSQTLLARHLRSEAAAARERQRIAARQARDTWLYRIAAWRMSRPAERGTR